MDERSETVRVEDERTPAPEPMDAAPDQPEQPTSSEQSAPTEHQAERPSDKTAESVPSQEQGRASTEGEQASRPPESSEGGSMGTLMADMEAYHSPHRGEVVEGIVVRIDKDGIMVDIGTKSEGMIPGHEQGSFGHEETLKIGDDVLVYVVQPENQDGHVVLSLRRARSERGWRTAQKQFEEAQTIEAEVIDYNRGGLIVDVDGVRGFVPMSQVVGLRHDSANESDAQTKMASMVGQTIPLKILEINRRRNRLILSERSATQELRSQRKEQLLAELEEGQVRHGHVSSICDFGAFVDLGGADGLVHLSELSWGQVGHPSEVVKVGDAVDVYVLGVDREKKKIALSLRRSQAEPWSKIADKYQVGDLVAGTITKLAQFGAFARIEDGIEGLIHISELSDTRIQHPRNVVKEGDELTLRIIRIDPVRRRLGLSLKQVEQPAEDQAATSGEGTVVRDEVPSVAEAPSNE